VNPVITRTRLIMASMKEAGMLRIGDKIETLRKAKGWSHEELAEKMGTTPSSVSRWKSGRVTPSAETLAQLAQLFDVTVDYLLFDDVPLQPRGGIKDPELLRQFEEIDNLDEEAKIGFKRFLKALIAEKRMKEVLHPQGA